jgi:Ca-activated chloride channel family protein
LQLALGLLAGGTSDRERVIMLVTDGQVGNEDDILRELAPALHDIKMFTLGIDRAVNAGFLRRLAAAGGGLCELVESEDRLDAVMAKVHRRIGAPIATELALRATGLDVDRATFAPAKLPDVYAGAPVVVFGRYRGSAAPGAAIEVEGTSLGDPLRMTVRMNREPASSTWLAASWARAHLCDLEDRYAAGAQQLEPTIVAVSRQFSVLSRFTAFLAVDRSAVVNAGGGLREVVQPVAMPSGWGGGSPAAPGGGGMTSVRVSSAPLAAASAMPKMIITHVQSVRAQPTAPPDDAPLAALGSPLLAPSSQPLAFFPSKSSSPSLSKSLSKSSSQSSPPSQSAAPRSLPPASPAAGGMSAAAISAMYLKQLPAFAVTLETLTTGVNAVIDPGQIRILRQRLAQWVEDLRSVGGERALADAVEALIERLTRALAAPDVLRVEIAAIADDLARLAAGAPPPPVKKKSRLAFWK